MYWLSGKTYNEISAITGWKRNTIWEDLKWMQDHLGSRPKTMESIRQMALMRLHLTRAEAVDAVRMAVETIQKGQEDGQDYKVRYADVAKLLSVAAEIDEHILSRYTPPEALEKPDRSADLDQKVKILIAWIINKLGPEGLDGFDEFYEQQLRIQETRKIIVDAKAVNR